LEILNLSYNRINVESIRNLYICKALKNLDISANSLEMLPADLSNLSQLEELNLSANLLTSVSTAQPPATLFKILGSIVRLKRLNLSRNRYFKFHSELLDPTKDFIQLQELDFSFNMVEDEQHLWFLTSTKSINIVNITGNPFA